MFLLLGLGRFRERLRAVSSLPTLVEASAAFKNLHGLLQGHAEGYKIAALNYTFYFFLIVPHLERALRRPAWLPGRRGRAGAAGQAAFASHAATLRTAHVKAGPVSLPTRGSERTTGAAAAPHPPHRAAHPSPPRGRGGGTAAATAPEGEGRPHGRPRRPPSRAGRRPCPPPPTSPPPPIGGPEAARGAAAPPAGRPLPLLRAGG